MNNLRLIASLFVAGSLAIAGGCTTEVTTTPGGPDSTLRVNNQSDFAIVELHVTSVGNASWGPNLLGNDSLNPGESITLGVNCGTYDALLVDDSGVDCEIHSVDLCLNDADWVIRNNTCTVFSAALAARQAAANANTSTAPLDAGAQ